MRFYGSIRLPFFKRFNPRIGFVTDRISFRTRQRAMYTPNQIDATTLMNAGSGGGIAGHPFAFLCGVMIGLVGICWITSLVIHVSR